jgi:hypothetical protein
VTLYGVLESIGEHNSVTFNILAVTRAGVVAAVKFDYSDGHEAFKQYPSPSSIDADVVEYSGIWETVNWTDVVAVCIMATICTGLMMCVCAPIIKHVIRERYQRQRLMISLAFPELGGLRNRMSTYDIDETAV